MALLWRIGLIIAELTTADSVGQQRPKALENAQRARDALATGQIEFSYRITPATKCWTV